MSEQDSASETFQRKISKLTQEKHLLRTRLNILKREDNPSSKSREQTRRTQQIEDITNRIALIDEGLKKNKYFLARAEDRPIAELSNLLQNLSVETERREKSFNKLEEFINLTAQSDMVFHSPTRSEEKKNEETVTNTVAPSGEMASNKAIASGETVAISGVETPLVSSEPLVTIASLSKQRVSFANIDSSEANTSNVGTESAGALTFSSTPKPTSKADVRTTMIYGSKVAPNTFEFPPTYENPEARAARLEKERFLKNEFDKRMELEYNMNNRPGKNTGAIPKAFKSTSQSHNNFDLDFELLQGEQKMIEDSIKASQRLMTQNLEHDWNNNINKFSEPNSLMYDGAKVAGASYEGAGAQNFKHSETIWRENPYKSGNDRPTPLEIKVGDEPKVINLIDQSISNLEMNRNSPYDNELPGQMQATRNDSLNLNHSHLSGGMDRNHSDHRNVFGQQYPQTIIRNENFNRNMNQSNQIAPRNANLNQSNNPYSNRGMNSNIPVGENFQHQANTQVAPRNANNNAQMNEGRNNMVRDSFLRRLRIIPKFSGDSFKDLRDFIDTAETLYYSCLNGAEEQEFYEQMALQLRGEPKLIVSRLENLEWVNVKETLLKKFAYLSNKDVLTSQIENLHQEQGESITKYTERARNLLREKNSIYSHLTEEQRTEHNRLARRAFSKGILDNKLREKIMIRGAGSLEDAIAFAIEAENDALTEVPRSELYCRFCHMNGHREKQCRRKESDNSDIGKLASAIRSLGFNNRNTTGNFPNNRRNFGNMNGNLGNMNRNFGNMNRNFAPSFRPNFARNGLGPNWNQNRYNDNNFARNGFNPNWNQNRYNDNNFSNENRNNNPFNRGPNWNQNRDQGQANQNQNQNNNFLQNRGNFQSNSRQQQRSNNVVRNARINTVQMNPHREIENDDFLIEQTEN